MGTWTSDGPSLSRRGLLKLGASTAALAGTGVVSGCAGLGGGSDSSGNQVDFFWYVEGKRSQYTLDAAKRFEKADGGGAIKPRFTGYQPYWDKLATEVAGGNPPDVFQLELARLSEYASRGTVRPIEDLLPDLVAQWEPDVRAACTYHGKVYFIPTGLSVTPGLNVNREALRKLDLDEPDPEWTVDEFTAFCGDVWQASGKKMHGCSDLGGNHWALEAYARGRGEKPFDGGRLGISRDTVKAWLALWHTLRGSKACVPMERSAEGSGFENSPVVTGEAAISDTASAKGLLGLQSLTRDELGLLNFPYLVRGAPTGTTIPPIEWWAISADADDDTAKLAAKFCEYLLTDPDNADGMVIEHGIPVVPDLRADAEAAATAAVKTTFDAFDTVRSSDPEPVTLPPKGASELMTQVLGKLNEDVGFGKTTSSEAADTFFDEAKKIGLTA